MPFFIYESGALIAGVRNAVYNTLCQFLNIMSEKPVSTLKTDKIEALSAARTVALVGLMGAGKSTVGRRLAKQLQMPFFDSDSEIEKAAGQTISDIFETMGEAEFRRGEQRVLARLLSGPSHVLATGGGAFLNPETRRLMREKAITIWLDADINTLWKRVSKRGDRPLIRRPDGKTVLQNLLQERTPIYQMADLHVRSFDGPHSQTVTAIIEALEAGKKAHI